MKETDTPLCPSCHKPMTFSHSLKSGANAYRCRRGCKTSAKVGDCLKAPAKTSKERRLAWKERDPIGYANSQKQRTERLKQRDPVAYAESNRLRQAKYRAKKQAIQENDA